MTPFFFGTSRRRLFGLYLPARSGGATVRAAVLCPPWGQEYLRAHRSMRQIASSLARAGVHVLRFDYHGTGDSAGDMTDGDCRGWQDDIATAIAELQEMSAATRVGLVGLRLGATLAAGVAAARPGDVDALVLWDPVVNGEAYLRELRQEAPPPQPGGELEVLGFLLGDGLAREVQALRLAPLAPALPARTLGLVTRGGAAEEELRAALAAAPATAVVERLVDEPAWLEERSTGVGAIPVKVVQRIVEWLG